MIQHARPSAVPHRPSTGPRPAAGSGPATAPPAAPGARRDGAPLPLDAVLARAVSHRAGRALVQRVGERKLGYVASTPANDAGLMLLKQALDEIKTERRKRKADFERDTLATLGTLDAKARQRAVMTDYVELLTKDSDVLVRLAATTPFTTGELKLAGTQVVDKGGMAVATLTVGKDAFVETTPSGVSTKTRRTFTRPGVGAKEYVADNRNAPTRRFAYVEKSIYQFMELISTGTMTGRYQSLQYSLGEAPAVQKMIAHESPIISTTGTTRTPDIDLTQLAVLHQWQGSGMNQRGLSLTSTPREGAIFGNAGDSFRSGDGVRMTIDLLKVPTDVILINHYSAEGVKSDLGTVNPALTRFPGRYNYVGSATKNRELFLERLDPDWIVDIKVHEGSGEKAAPTATGKKGAELLGAISATVAHAQYVAGFKSAVEGGTLPVTPAPEVAFKKGFDSGTTYLKGYANGKPQRAAFETEALRVRAAIQTAYTTATGGGGEAAALAKARQLKPTPPKKKRAPKGATPAPVVTPPKTPEQLASAMVCDTMIEQGYAAMSAIDLTGWLALTSFSRADRDQYDIYWVGWSHSARDKPKRSVMDAGFYTLA